MDPLTHTFVGAALAATALGRSTRLARAALLVGANLPDVDVLSHLAGSDAALGFRRGWTHGVLAMLVLPLVLTAVLTGYGRLRPAGGGAPALDWRRLLGLCALACWTHPLLDLLNTYGVRLLMPFDDRWFYGDSTFIVDPWLWLVAGGAAFLGSRSRGVPWGWIALAALTSAVVVVGRGLIPVAAPWIWAAGLVVVGGLRATRPGPERTAAAGLGVGSVYIAAMIGLSFTGAGWARAELERKGIGDVGRLMVGPLPANPLAWNVVAETPEAYHCGILRWLPRPRLSLAAMPIALPDDGSPAVAASRGDPRAQGTLGWMRFPSVEIENDDAGPVLHWADVRYACPPRSDRESFGTATIRLDRDLRPRH